jgi:hypothetical protein
VEAVLPPKARVIAERTALFPPNETFCLQEATQIEGWIYFRYALDTISDKSLMDHNKVPIKKLTNNEINLRPKAESEKFVAHELRHLDIFDDTVLSNTLPGI